MANTKGQLKSIFFACAVVAVLGATLEARAAILDVSGGILTGARNVDVSGTLFDVEFVDGTCIALFDGCDDVSDFDFASSAEAEVAAQALLDQVFLDVGAGLFDTDPELTFGCQDAKSCQTLIPYALFSADTFLAAGAFNDDGPMDRAFPRLFIGRNTDYTSSKFGPRTNFARFTPASAAPPPPVSIPEPSALFLFGMGLAGFAVFTGGRRLRQRD